MSHSNRVRPAALSRRAALLLPLAAAGCSLFDDWFGDKKTPLEGKRSGILAAKRGLQVDNPPDRKIVLPRPEPVLDSPQAGGTPSHVVGHIAVNDALAEAWHAGIGEGGGYRRKITSQPVIADGRVLTMDSDGYVSAYDTRTGARQWRLDTQADGDRSSNVGGGVSISGGRAYAATGRGEVIAIEAATGTIVWRTPIPTAARAAPTIAEGRLFVPTLDDQMIALAMEDGKRAWTYQAQNATTSMLGLPSPAYADGLLVGGFGSGDLVAFRANTGTVAWSDSLASTRGRTSAVDFSAVRGMPVIVGNTVYAISLGGLMLALDLRSGRRLWERDIASADTPCVAGDWVFILSTDQQVAALNRTDGRVAWVTQIPQWENQAKLRDPIVWNGPTLAGDRLLLAGSSKAAISVSPYTGKILGTQTLDETVSLPPVIAGRTAYIITDDGSLRAFR
jgi:outer membrane protein assembly factor BamB